MRTTPETSMAPIVLNSREWNKPPFLGYADMYVDTIELSSSRAIRSELLGELRPLCGSVFVDVIRDKNDPSVVWRHLLKVNQPSRPAIMVLDRYMRRATHSVGIYRVHIALDFDNMLDVTRERLIEFIETAIHLRHRRDSDETHRELDSLYAIKTKCRKTRPSKTSIFYCDEMGALDGECDKIHYEIRLENKRTVLASGIEYPSDLFGIVPRILAARHLKIANHKPILAKVLRHVRRETIRLCPRPHVDVAKRVRSYADRQWRTLTDFKKDWPRQYERLEGWDVLLFGSELEWVKAPKRRVRMNLKSGKMRSLSPRPQSDPQSSHQIEPTKRRKVRRFKL